MITASGEIVTANATTNEDLFWGVRGGGGNFGVVTNFVLKLHPQPRKVFAGPVVFPLPMLGPVVSALEEWLSTASPLANAMLVFTPGPDGNPAIIVLLVYHGGEEEGKEAFKLILDLGKHRGAYVPSCQQCRIGPVANMTSMIPYEALNGITNHAAVPGKHYYVSGTTRTYLTAETAVAIHDHLLKMRASHPRLGEFVMIWEYYSSGKKVTSVEPDAMAFRMRTSDLPCLLVLKWDGEIKDEEVKAKAEQLVTEHCTFCEKLIKAQPGYLQRPEADKGVSYGNYSGLIESILQGFPPLI